MPQLHSETFADALRRAAGFDDSAVGIEERLAQIPAIESLTDLPEGTPVWIRADLDVDERSRQDRRHGVLDTHRDPS